MGQADIPDPRRSVIWRAVAATAIGNAMEWYDFSVMTVLTTLYFTKDHDAASLLFVLGFVLRTPGGIFSGPLGDRIGRQKVLAGTVLLMSAGTFCIGLLPEFYGRYAVPFLLLRMIQGFSTGGEYVGAATIMAEYAPTRKRGFYGSFLEVGTLTGLIAGVLMVMGVHYDSTQAFFNTWGWRIPFLLALPFGIIGLYLRLRLTDTPTFEAAVPSGGRPRHTSLRQILTDSWAILTGHWRMLANLIGIVVLLNIAYYLLLSWIPKYFRSPLHVRAAEGMTTLVVIETLMLISLPFLGTLSDRFGRKPLLITSAAGFIVLSYPCFWLMEKHTPAGLIVGFGVMGLLLAMMQAVIASTFPAMFPTRVRYGAFAIGYNLSTSVFGGTAPTVVAWLLPSTGISTIPAYYLILAAAIALIPILLIPETAKVPMDKIKAWRAVTPEA